MISRTQLFSPFAWAAGVLDTGGRFYITDGSKGNSASVRLSGPTATLDEFARVMLLPPIPGPVKGTDLYSIPAKEQERVLGLLLPYMVGQHAKASVVYRYRVTAPTRRLGWKLTTPIKAYREKLKERL